MDKNTFKFIIALAVVAAAIVIFFINKADESQDKIINTNTQRMTEQVGVILKTNQGDIELELFGDLAPKTVANFVKLAEEGFYNGTKFHRVIAGFMIQGGDPQSKDDSLKDVWGTGGPGYQFEDEIHRENRNVIGTISMANAGPDTNGSQFFINVSDNNFLDTKHTVFGKVVKGGDTVNKIVATPTEGPDRPVEDVIIEKIILK